MDKPTIRSLVVGLILVVLAAGPVQADGSANSLPPPDALPIDPQAVAGVSSITIDSAKNQLVVDQGADRAVIRWGSFDIGTNARVLFQQAATDAALNIVDGDTSSIIAGSLSAPGSVFLINPHGITVTPDGKIDTGGAFVASTLGLDDEDFSNFTSGSNNFTFETPVGVSAGDVRNAGLISARDVVLLGSRVENAGPEASIFVPQGRVALGSASHATLNFGGDGFLQVLVPANIDEGDTNPLITNSGSIVADGGLVQLKASTVHNAIREAIHMPGEVRARSVSGQDGSIVFSGGDGGNVVVPGKVDAGRGTEQAAGGGSVEVLGSKVDFNFAQLNLSAGGRFLLAAHEINITEHESSDPFHQTEIIEKPGGSGIGNLLHAGVNVTLHASENLTWASDLMIVEDEIASGAGGKAGNLHLLAAGRIALGGDFATYNSDWTLTANARQRVRTELQSGSAVIDMFAAGLGLSEFGGNDGHLTLEILGGENSAGLPADSIQLPVGYSGRSLTARIASDTDGYDTADIRIYGDIDVTEDVVLSGHLRTIPQGEHGSLTTVQGRSISWTTETSDRLAGGLLRFVEDNVVTRFGRGGSGETGPDVDSTRLMLGGSSAATRVYGDSNPDQTGLDGLVLTVAPHNKRTPGEGAMNDSGVEMIGIPAGGIPLGEILAPGSISVAGPDNRAATNVDSDEVYYLTLTATDQIAFKPLDYEWTSDGQEDVPRYVGGAAGALWIDLSGDNEFGNRVPLTITPRPLTAEILYPNGSPVQSYTYGSPNPLVRLDGVVAGDDIRPTGTLNTSPVTYDAVNTGRFGLNPRTNVGDYVYTVTGIDGEGAHNYSFDFSGLPVGNIGITPREVTVQFDHNLERQTYGSVTSPLSVTGWLAGDDVEANVRLLNGQGVDDVFRPRLDVGEYTLSMTGLKGRDAGNYKYELIGFSVDTGTAPFTVTPKILSWTVSNTTTTYGDSDTPVITLDGVIDEDDVYLDAAWLRSTGASGSAFSTGGHRVVGEYTLDVNGLGGASKHNYTVAEFGNTADKWTISPRLLHMPSIGSVAYGDPFEFQAPERDGAAVGDDIRIAVEVDGHPYPPLRPFLDPGTYDSRFTGIIGDDARNYALRDSGASRDIELTITKRPVTVHVLDGTRTYGDDPITMLGHVRIDNLFQGDLGSIRDLNFSVVTDPKVVAPMYERTPAGSHLVQVARLNHPKYELASEGHTAGRIVIEPKPLRYTTPNWEVEYGKVDPYLGRAVLNESDIVSGDDVLPGTVIIADRERYPERLPTNNKYWLALAGLSGSAKDNYAIEHIGSTQGLLTVLPKPISHTGLVLDYNGTALNRNIWNFGDLETMHGFTEGEHDGPTLRVDLSGVLPGDDVSAAILHPELEYSSQGYLASGEYVWTLSGLTGSDNGNYVLSNGNAERPLEIRPRPVRLYAEKYGLEYGHAVPNVDLRFDDDNEKFFVGAALDVTNITFRSSKGTELTWDDVWNGPPVRLPAGFYFTRILDESKPFLIGEDAKNFDATLGGYIEVTPRTLSFTPPLSTSWVYGRAFSERHLYDAVIDQYGAPGVLPGDDVGFQYWSVGRGISENNLHEPLDTSSRYNPAGEYAGFGFRLTGADADNYELIQPDYTVTITPRPLEFPLNWLYPGDDDSWEYVIDFTDVLRPQAGEYGDVMPGDGDDLFVGVRDGDGLPRPIHETDAGRYDMQSLALTGHRAGNYELVLRQPDAFLRINPLDLLFSIGDVNGHYGNFVACLDPRTCNGGPQGPYGDQHLWVPGLKLGDVELEGILPGHDVSVGDVVLIDGAGRTGRLEDVPQPGVYFQVVDGLVGEDARNYRIASTGSRPGILTIFPQWVRWETTDGIYMPETGFRSLNPDPDYDVHPRGEFLPGLQATLKGADGDLDLDPKFQFIGLDIDLWEHTFIGNPRSLRPGNYSIEVADFAGDAGALYQPVPGSIGSSGILSVFADSRLGLESAGTINGGLLPPGRNDSSPGSTPSNGSPASGGATGSDAAGVGAASDTNSSPGFGDQFGARVDPELFHTAGLRGDAYAGALAEYGVTGVKLKAEAGIEVEYEIGAGYVRTGAEARAQAEIGPTGVTGSTRVTATVGGGGGGSLGGGVDGRGEARVGVIATAEGEAGLLFEDGNFKLGTKTHVGAGASVGAEGSLSWHAGSVDAGVTVYSPGSIGQNFSFGAGMDGAVLTIDAVLGASLGFGGLELDLGFSIDLGGLRDGFESFACGSGIVSCSPSQLDLGKNHALAARDMENPLERFAYLYQNDQWRYVGGAIQAGQNVDEDIAQAYYENRAFFDYVEGLLTDVERYITEQEQAQAQFFRDLEEDPMSALNMARNTYSEHNYFTRQAQSIHQRMTAIGMQLELRRENLEGLGVD